MSEQERVESPKEPETERRDWEFVRITFPAGGGIEVSCSRCGHIVEFAPRDGEAPPDDCPGCGA